MANKKFLDNSGVSTLWQKVDAKFVDVDSLTLVINAVDEEITDHETRITALEESDDSSSGGSAFVDLPLAKGASGTNSLIINDTNYNSATADYATAQGSRTTASGPYSHAEGSDTVAEGSYAHAEGYETLASGESAHAEGKSCRARGYCSHAEGYLTFAAGQASHTSGWGTYAASSCQFVEGIYNVSDTTSLHIVGNGTSNSARSNAYTLDASGNGEYAGDVIANGCGGSDPVSLSDTWDKLSQILWTGSMTGHGATATFSIPLNLLHNGKLTLLIEASPNAGLLSSNTAQANALLGDFTSLISIACGNNSSSNNSAAYYNSTGPYVANAYAFSDLFASASVSSTVGLQIQISGRPTNNNLQCTVKLTGSLSYRYIHTISAINIREM